MVSCLIILFEAIAVWISYFIPRRMKLELKLFDIYFIVSSVFLFYITSIYIFLKPILIIIPIMMVVWCKKRFEVSVFSSVLNSFAAYVIVGFVEVLVIVFTYSIKTYSLEDEKNYFLLSVSTCLVVYCVYRIRYTVKKISFKFEATFIIVFAISISLFVAVKLYFEINRTFYNGIYLLSFLVLGISVFLLFREKHMKYELEKKNLELDMNKIYGSAYKELIKDVRKKQHDFDNQISAVYSMCLATDSYEELVNMQKEYIKNIKSDRKFDSILTKCNVPILAGYLYNLCIGLEELKIDVACNVCVDEISDKISILDIVRLIGIFTNNAGEYLSENNCDKKIKLRILTNEKIEIEISNTCKDLSLKTINSMFEYGYSTKGENRGIGLASAKEIVEKYKGEIYVNKDFDGVYEWFSVRVVI